MDSKTLLTWYKAAQDGASDYRVAQLLGFKKQTVSAWKRGTAGMSDEAGIKVAQALQLDPHLVLVALQLERSRSPAASRAWALLYRRLEQATAPAVAGFAGLVVGLSDVPILT